MVNNGMTRTKILFYILTLGFITPIGIIVGMVLTLDAETALDPTQSIAVGVLQVIIVSNVFFIVFLPNFIRETWVCRYLTLNFKKFTTFLIALKFESTTLSLNNIFVDY